MNGYPLVFPDTGSYLVAALDWRGIADRPPYYSLLILPFHLGVSLWPVALAQSAAAAASIRLAARLVAPALAGWRFVAAIAALAALTSLPWHADMISPDLFAGLVVLWVFALAFGWDELGRGARALLALATAGAIATHQSHLPLALALFAAAALLRAWQGGGAREAARIAALGAGACAAAVAGFVAYGWALTGRPTLSPQGNVFLMARLLEDGPASDYLRESCPASGNPFCRHLDAIGRDHVEFLWGADSGIALVVAEVGPAELRRAAAEVVAGTVAEYPGRVAAAAARNTLLQLVRFGTLDTLCPPGCAPGSFVDQAIAKHFAREYPRYRESRQLRGELPVAPIRALDAAAVALAASGTALLLARRRGGARFAALCALVATALLANAFTTGALSGPWPRYQSRLIWLVPLCALLGAAAPAAAPSEGGKPAG